MRLIPLHIEIDLLAGGHNNVNTIQLQSQADSAEIRMVILSLSIYVTGH